MCACVYQMFRSTVWPLWIISSKMHKKNKDGRRTTTLLAFHLHLCVTMVAQGVSQQVRAELLPLPAHCIKYPPELFIFGIAAKQELISNWTKQVLYVIYLHCFLRLVQKTKNAMILNGGIFYSVPRSVPKALAERRQPPHLAARPRDVVRGSLQTM